MTRITLGFTLPWSDLVLSYEQFIKLSMDLNVIYDIHIIFVKAKYFSARRKLGLVLKLKFYIQLR